MLSYISYRIILYNHMKINNNVICISNYIACDFLNCLHKKYTLFKDFKMF